MFCAILFVLLMISGCSTVLERSIDIEYRDISLDFSGRTQRYEGIYHVYFENIHDRTYSTGSNFLNPMEQSPVVTVFPGIYTVYAYVLVDKTETSHRLYAYCIMEEVVVTPGENEVLPFNFKVFEPMVGIRESEEGYLVYVDMRDIYSICRLSSLSIKQGDIRNKALDFVYDDETYEYQAVINDFHHGEWMVNISYALKSKRDNDVLKTDGIYISTSSFKGIYLGFFGGE